MLSYIYDNNINTEIKNIIENNIKLQYEIGNTCWYSNYFESNFGNICSLKYLSKNKFIKFWNKHNISNTITIQNNTIDIILSDKNKAIDNVMTTLNANHVLKNKVDEYYDIGTFVYNNK